MKEATGPRVNMCCTYVLQNGMRGFRHDHGQCLCLSHWVADGDMQTETAGQAEED